MENLLAAFLLIFGLQVLFFIVAAWLKTDKLTDLSYGLTFIIVALWAVYDSTNPWFWLLAIMITVWGTRLAAYLFVRILDMKKDQRFDGIRESLPKFAQFWFFQALTIFVVISPLLVLPQSANYAVLSVVALAIWVLGLLVESSADWEKYHFKKKFPKKFVNVGLWSRARHPNYFGEMLCWWGVFLFVTPHITGWAYVTILSPLYIMVILLFASGVPMLEKQHDKKYGSDPEYKKWKKETNLLWPF